MSENEFEGMTPDQAKEKIGDVMGDASNPYFDRGHPNHKRAAERMTRLYEIAYGSETEDEDDPLASRLRDQGIETIEDLEKLEDEALTKQEKEELEKTDEAMKKAFGNKYDEVAELSALGVDFAKEEFPDLLDTLEEFGPDGKALGNNPDIVKVFANLGKLVKKAQGGAEE